MQCSYFIFVRRNSFEILTVLSHSISRVHFCTMSNENGKNGNRKNNVENTSIRNASLAPQGLVQWTGFGDMSVSSPAECKCASEFQNSENLLSPAPIQHLSIIKYLYCTHICFTLYMNADKF